ncbi:MAG: glycosyltransferase [bacterium]
MSPPLRVAIVHYHLRPGGVTTVIERAVAALQAHDVQTVVLCGAEPGPERAGTVRTVPGLDYDDDGDPAGLADALLDTAREALGGEPDILHVHNHAVGKSGLLPCALHELARRGKKLLLQIHDFAEDGRPGNFRKLVDEVGRGSVTAMAHVLYPVAPHVHYALLNLRDLALLTKAGLPAGFAHHLPNCVTDGETLPPPEGPPFFVYPTRAIRRKNLGEFLLWSALSEPGAQWATTLAPNNPAERVYYDSWVQFAGELRLPVEFEVGTRRQWSLTDLMRAASAIVTTSVAEGFGLAFLEPWLSGRPLHGRNIPDVTLDMAEAGLELDNLYNALLVPVEWIGIDRMRQSVDEGLQRLFEAYGRPLPAGALEKACHGLDSRDTVDFGRLDEAMQRDVIRRVANDADAAALLQPPRLAQEPVPAATIARNQAVVRDKFGPDTYAQRLLTIYQDLAISEPGPLSTLSIESVLDGFLDPSQFRLLRT